MGTHVHKFEKNLPIVTALVDDSSDPPNTSIFVSPASNFVPSRTIDLELENTHGINGCAPTRYRATVASAFAESAIFGT